MFYVEDSSNDTKQRIYLIDHKQLVGISFIHMHFW